TCHFFSSFVWKSKVTVRSFSINGDVIFPVFICFSDCDCIDREFDGGACGGGRYTYDAKQIIKATITSLKLTFFKLYINKNQPKNNTRRSTLPCASLIIPARAEKANTNQYSRSIILVAPSKNKHYSSTVRTSFISMSVKSTL